MSFIRVFFLFSWLIVPAVAFGAVESFTPIRARDSRTEVLSGGDIYNKRLLQDLENLNEGSRVHIDAFVLSNDKLARALLAAHKRGAVVSVNADRSFSLNNRLCKKLEEEGIEVHRGGRRNHNKRVLIDDGTGNKITYIGSANSSRFARLNEEVMTRMADARVHEAFLKDHKNIAASPARTRGAAAAARATGLAFEETPDRPTAVSSREHDLLGTVRARLSFEGDHSERGRASRSLDTPRSAVSPASEPFDRRSLSLSTMNFTDSPMKHALVKQAQDDVDVKVLVDGSTLQSQEGLRHLKEMADAGVQVHVYNPYGEIKYGKLKSIGHAKMVIRRAPTADKHLVIFSTKNLTVDTGDSNSAVFIPGDEQVLEDSTQVYENMLKKAVPFSEIELSDFEHKPRGRKRSAAASVGDVVSPAPAKKARSLGDLNN